MIAIFAGPLLVALVCSGGLVAGLLGDGWWDAASWVGLGVPVVVAVARWRGGAVSWRKSSRYPLGIRHPGLAPMDARSSPT